MKMVKMYLIQKLLLVYCNIANDNYQQDARVLYTFFLNKSFGQLLFHPKILEFSCIEVWFTDQNSKPLEIEDKRNITLFC